MRYGIDISNYQDQKVLNLLPAKDDDCSFVIIKATEGISYTNPLVKKQADACSQADLDFGFYHYFHNTLDPIEQAHHFVDVMELFDDRNLHPSVDVEERRNAGTPEIARDHLKTFLDEVEVLTGKKCFIYTSQDYWDNLIGPASWASRYHLWIANYLNALSEMTLNAAAVEIANHNLKPLLPHDWSSWKIWQFSSTGKVQGILGRVDCNISSGFFVESATSISYRVTATAGLNVRIGPGIAYAKVATLPYNTVVQVIETIDGWANIVSPVSGWCSEVYLRKV